MASIRDVARLSGVSTATVSHVLHGRHDRVSAETRTRVLAAIRELRYRPPLFVTQNDNAVTRSIGVVAHDLTHSPLSAHAYYSAALDGIIEAAFFRGWTVHLFVERMWDDIGTSVRRGYDGRCDGLIYIAPPTDNQSIHSLQERGVPMVLVGTSAFLPDVSSVDIDNEAVGNTIIRYLINLGHRNFLFLGIGSNVSAVSEREEGIRRGLNDAGLSADGLTVMMYGRDENIRGCLEAALHMPTSKRPTAVIAWNDGSALRVLTELIDMGIDVPRSMSVVGVDNDPRTLTTRPQLTTVGNPVTAIGRRAANLLIDRVLDPSQPTETVKFAPDLIVRTSSAQAPEVPPTLSKGTRKTEVNR